MNVVVLHKFRQRLYKVVLSTFRLKYVLEMSDMLYSSPNRIISKIFEGLTLIPPSLCPTVNEVRSVWPGERFPVPPPFP